MCFFVNENLSFQNDKCYENMSRDRHLPLINCFEIRSKNKRLSNNVLSKIWANSTVLTAVTKTSNTE